ncbi:MAG: hypothetical protein AB7N76_16930 [Planctomycetota bacterium]
MRRHLALAAVLLAVVAAPAQAQDDTYHYALDGRYGTFGPKFDSTLTLTKRPDGRYDVTRSWQYHKAGEPAPRLNGVADVKVNRERYKVGNTWRTRPVVAIDVTFTEKRGATATLEELAGNEVAKGEELRGTYQVRGNDARGWVSLRGRDGKVKRVYESGKRTTDPVDYGDMPAPGATTSPDGGANAPDGGASTPDGGANTPGGGSSTTAPEAPIAGDTLPGQLDESLKVLEPAPGVYLAGQRARVRVTAGTLKVVKGEASVKGNQLAFNEPGPVRVQIEKDGKVSRPVDLEAVEAEIVAITVEDRLELADAPAPHFRRELGAPPEQFGWEPAAIYANTQLRLTVTLKAKKDLTAPARVKLSAAAGDVDLQGQADLRGLAAGQQVEVLSGTALSEAVGVHPLDCRWSLDAGDDRRPVGDVLKLRVYTTFAEPVDNPLPRYGPTQRQGLPLKSKLHFELACTWAEGASRNVGDGGESIGHKVDNALRHHVAWKDYGSSLQYKPVIPHYPEGTAPPLNYEDLPTDTWGGKGNVRDGRRDVSPLYYPPLEVKKPYENYENYRNNFGWWVLDNPQYAGGRCNQQASLISDVCGTLGLKAEVYYIERTGRGKKTGRPVRRYYKSSRSPKTWNFHGQCQVEMEDGSHWLYDGSGSWPPNRINGRVDDLMRVPGKYVDYWEAWSYDDGMGGGFAPMDDWPDTFQGVPIQPGEAPLDPKAKDGTYVYDKGRGKTTKGNIHRFYAINVGGVFIYKVDKGTLDAPTYTYAEHGQIAEWYGHD